MNKEKYHFLVFIIAVDWAKFFLTWARLGQILSHKIGQRQARPYCHKKPAQTEMDQKKIDLGQAGPILCVILAKIGYWALMGLVWAKIGQAMAQSTTSYLQKFVHKNLIILFFSFHLINKT